MKICERLDILFSNDCFFENSSLDFAFLNKQVISSASSAGSISGMMNYFTPLLVSAPFTTSLYVCPDSVSVVAASSQCCNLGMMTLQLGWRMVMSAATSASCRYLKNILFFLLSRMFFGGKFSVQSIQPGLHSAIVWFI